MTLVSGGTLNVATMTLISGTMLDAAQIVSDTTASTTEDTGINGEASNTMMLKNGNMDQIITRTPKLVIPFVPGVSERLKKVASSYNVRTWFTYPGRISDWFTVYRGRQHTSKAQHTVYCTICSCGLQYVGESKRNLKVRICEHLQNTSASAISTHIHSTDHSLLTKDTMILARERSSFKRKLLESLAIENKRARLCNTGLSLEIPGIWRIFSEHIRKDLAFSD